LVDGGLTANDWAMQFLADVCNVEVARPAFQEVTALGAAKLAAFGSGVSTTLAREGLETVKRWTPRMTNAARDRLTEGWRKAVAGALAVAG
jgi:glycerol kinase